MFQRTTTRLTAHALIIGTTLLAVLLAVVTVRTVRREQNLMESSLLKEGLTLIRAFEAGARTSMMMTMMRVRPSPLETLVRETSRSPEVAYIRVEDERGRVLATAGESVSGIPRREVAEVLAATGPSTRLLRSEEGEGVFEVAREFDPVDPELGQHAESMHGRWRDWCGVDSQGVEGICRQVIFVGLRTRDFETARRAAVRQSLIWAGILLIAGTGGFYVLLLDQRVRVARATIEDLELYARNVIESLPDSLLTLDATSRIDTMNRRCEEFFGTRESEARGRALPEIFPPNHCDLGGLLGVREELRDQPLDCAAPTGEALPLRVDATALRDRKGERVGTVVVLRDQRAIRAMEEQLERSRRLSALGELAAGIAHEIRNPLGTLRGFAQYFGRRAGEDAVAREYADLMVTEIDRLNRSIEALLRFARPREPEFQWVDLETLLARVEKFVEGDAAARGLALRVEMPAAGAGLRADPDLLIHALLNLLQNAMEASESGGEVSVDVTLLEEEVHLQVSDTGRGLTPEVRERMFDPFYTTRKDGTGLGLAVVHQVIEQHGGRIEVESTPGRGTTVSVILRREGDGEDA